MTMDILWAISHPTQTAAGGIIPNSMFAGAAAAAGTFAVPTPPYADGSWEMYQDFVGGVQFWGYALVSGSGDGAVRMWDSEFIFNSQVNVISDASTHSAYWAGTSDLAWTYCSCNLSAV